MGLFFGPAAVVIVFSTVDAGVAFVTPKKLNVLIFVVGTGDDGGGGDLGAGDESATPVEGIGPSVTAGSDPSILSLPVVTVSVYSLFNKFATNSASLAKNSFFLN